MIAEEKEGNPGLRALVVDDDATTRCLLQNVLSRFGSADSRADGAEAVRAALAAVEGGAPYDLICMDIMMPKMDGLEALHRIRLEEERHGRPRLSKVIVLTSSEDAGNVEEAFGCLCDAYLNKPIHMAAFLSILECLCEVDSGELLRSLAP
jgi:two-component system, chemotaxis family, chemotaxis protein CheY